jgi:hypothetical protein
MRSRSPSNPRDGRPLGNTSSFSFAEMMLRFSRVEGHEKDSNSQSTFTTDKDGDFRVRDRSSLVDSSDLL